MAERIIEVIKHFEKVCIWCFDIISIPDSWQHDATLQINAAKVTTAARFKEDLDLDSLDAVEVVMAIEEEFNIEIPDSEADKILSIPDAVAYISTHPMAK